MKKVLFLCRENACRSRMAEAFAARFGKEVIESYSAGTEPAREADPMVYAVLRERGLDTEDLKPKGIDEMGESQFDMCITFNCCSAGLPPEVHAGEMRKWTDIEDPRGKQYAVYRGVRERIGRKVLALIKELREAE